jgi:type II secretion system protein G
MNPLARWASPFARTAGRRDRRRAAGFTLIELLVVLVILGLLAAFAAPQVLNYLSRAKSDAAKAQVQNIASILDLYRLDVGSYPDDRDGLDALLGRFVAFGDAQSFPREAQAVAIGVHGGYGARSPCRRARFRRSAPQAG